MNSKRVEVISMQVNLIDLREAVSDVISLALKKNGAYVCVSNVHMCMESYDCQDFRKVVNQADLVIPDGRPISWAQRLLGNRLASQVRGQDIMSALCEKCAENGLKVGLYGGASEELVAQVADRLENEYPGLNIVYRYSPPFRPLTIEEDGRVIEEINGLEVDILFVGIGCPKQEIWMADHKPALKCVMLGVGAAFDFIAGSKSHAPRWMQSIGLEWAFRLFSEPRRLWRRYSKQNPRFIYHFLIQIIRVKFVNRRSSYVK